MRRGPDGRAPEPRWVVIVTARPVSADNPYSEPPCKTLQYRPEFPARFPRLAAARRWVRQFFHGYHTQHGTADSGDCPQRSSIGARGLASSGSGPRSWPRPTPATRTGMRRARRTHRPRLTAWPSILTRIPRSKRA